MHACVTYIILILYNIKKEKRKKKRIPLSELEEWLPDFKIL